MSISAAVALPAFPAALLPAGTVQPSALFSPINIQSTYSKIDPFSKKLRYWNQINAQPYQNSPFMFKSPSTVVPISPMQKLRDVQRSFEAARQALSTNNRTDTWKKYSEALNLLETPADDLSDHPLFTEIINGPDLFKEALFGTIGFSGPEHAADNINRLEVFIRSADENTCPLDLAKAKLLKTYSLFQHAASADEPQETLYKRTLRQANDVVEKFPSDHKANDDVIFYGNLLRIEILARLLCHAHNRGDHKEEFVHADEIKAAFIRITDPETPKDRLELIGEYKADVATLMARIGLWGPALEMARRVTAYDSPFKDTAGAQRLLSEKIFERFTEDDGTKREFLQAGELRLRVREYSLLRRIMMAFAMAYSEGLKQTAVYGGAGLLTGLFADQAFLHGAHTMIAGATGAAAFTAYNRLRNGWKTPESVYASEIGTNNGTAEERTWKHSVRDVAMFALKSGIYSAPWIVPAALIDAGMEGVNIAADTLSRAGDLYYRFGEWAVTGMPALAQPETYSGIADLASDISAARIAYHAYTGAAGALYLGNLFSSRARRFTDRWAWLFLPGAVALSADIGMAITGQPPWIDRVLNHILSLDMSSLAAEPWFDRVQRAGIVSLEMIFLMLTAGLLPLENRTSPKKIGQSIAKVLNPISKHSSYALPLTGAMLANVGSAMGGMMQKGSDATNLPFTLMAIQGAATVAGLLGITLGISGILKAQIPIGTGIKEGWQDSAGEALHRRIAAMFLGAADAFRYPYAQNRVFRSCTWDLPAAALRTMLGWDTNAGQIALSSTNFLSGNGMATSTWPETGGTQWERDQIIKWTDKAYEDLKAIEERRQKGDLTDLQALALKQEKLAQLHDFFIKAGQVMNPLHILAPHGSVRAPLWPLISWTRSGFPPSFPHTPNEHLYANLHQLIDGNSAETLEEHQMKVLLEYISTYGRSPDHHPILKPLVKMLAMDRASQKHGKVIEAFFANNPWIEEFAGIDLDDYEPPTSKYRRKVRKALRKAVGVKYKEYENRTKSHRRQQQGAQHFADIFTVRSPDPITPAKSVEESMDQPIVSVSEPPIPIIAGKDS